MASLCLHSFAPIQRICFRKIRKSFGCSVSTFGTLLDHNKVGRGTPRFTGPRSGDRECRAFTPPGAEPQIAECQLTEVVRVSERAPAPDRHEISGARYQRPCEPCALERWDRVTLRTRLFPCLPAPM